MRHPDPTENAFAPHFLARFDPEDDPATATEAQSAGPWKVEPHPAGGWSVRRRWEGAGGAPPVAVFVHRQPALLAATALPLAGRDAAYRLGKQPTERGFPVALHGRPAGHLPWFDDELVRALDLLDALARSPAALASLLLAAGPSALRLTGAALAAEGGRHG
jgi:hypothetical protein